MLAQAALPGPPLGGHLCPLLGTPGQHPEAGLLLAGHSGGCVGVVGAAGWLAQDVPGRHSTGLSAAQSFA